MAGCVEGSRRALFPGLVLVAGPVIEPALSEGPPYKDGCPVVPRY